MIENIKYTGVMANHMRESRFIRDKNQRRVPKEEWYIRKMHMRLSSLKKSSIKQMRRFSGAEKQPE